MKTLAITVLLLHFIPAFFSYYGYDDAFYVLFEVQFLLVCLAAYFICPMRQWRLKLIWCVSSLCAVGFFVHNVMILTTDDTTIWAYSTFIVLFFISLILGIPLFRHWDSMPNDKIEPGNYYEIIGKPRTDLQFLLFMVTGGRGGSYAITDGINMVKMSRSESKSIIKPLDYNYLNGKKCIMIGTSGISNKRTFNNKIGVKWSLWRTCYWLSQGFKNA